MNASTSIALALPPRGMPCPSFSPFPIFQAAVDEVVQNIQAPQPLILASALTAISVVSQGLINVRRPTGQVGPASVMTLVIGDTGERKTTADDIFQKAIRNFQAERAKEYETELKEWRTRMEVWGARRKTILKEVAKKDGDHYEMAELLRHDSKKPVKPKQFKMLYEDSTSEALFHGMSEGCVSAGLMSSEARGVLNGPAFSDHAKINAIWTGSTITVDRKSTDSFVLKDVRLTVSMMVQPIILSEYMEKSGELSLGSGLLSRCLVSMPITTQGTRFLRSPTLSWEYIPRFERRINELLARNVQFQEEQTPPERIVFQYDTDACQLWTMFFNGVEAEIQPGRRFHCVGGLASKLAENVARVSALLHFFEGFEGDISISTLNFAISYCLYCSDEYLRLFVPPPREVLDADELMAWLSNIRNTGRRYVPKNYVRQFCLNKLRKSGRLDAALDVLRVRGEISLVCIDQVVCIDLQPFLPGDSQRGSMEVQSMKPKRP